MKNDFSQRFSSWSFIEVMRKTLKAKVLIILIQLPRMHYHPEFQKVPLIHSSKGNTQSAISSFVKTSKKIITFGAKMIFLKKIITQKFPTGGFPFNFK